MFICPAEMAKVPRSAHSSVMLDFKVIVRAPVPEVTVFVPGAAKKYRISKVLPVITCPVPNASQK